MDEMTTDNNLLTSEDVNRGLDAIVAQTHADQAELHFLRFIYNWFKEHCSDGGTDEVYWAAEQYTEENGVEPPKGYNGV
jgi:hypothetical protein